VNFAFHRLSFQTTAMLFELEPDTTYFFRVRGVNSGGRSPYSNVASARTEASAPLAPSGLTATAVSRSRIDLAWTDGSTSEDRFDVERSTDGRAFRVVGSVGPNVTRFSDTSRLKAGTSYTYRVRACNDVGCSLPSNPATATTPGR
jgi:predicted phage tail protein